MAFFTCDVCRVGGSELPLGVQRLGPELWENPTLDWFRYQHFTQHLSHIVSTPFAYQWVQITALMNVVTILTKIRPDPSALW